MCVPRKCLVRPLAIAILGLAASVAHAFGEADGSFNPVSFPGEQCRGEVGARPDGTLFVYNESLDTFQFPADGFIYKVMSSGALDASWGTGGRAPALGATRPSGPVGLASLPDGSLLALNWNIARFTRSGTLDAAYASQGLFASAGLPENYGYEVLGDGSVVLPLVHGIHDANGNVSPILAFARVGPDGVLDTSFGNNGYADIPVGPEPYAWSVMSDGSMEIGTFVGLPSGGTIVQTPVLKRYPAGTGVADGEAALAVMPRDGTGSWTAPWVGVDGEGRMYAAVKPAMASTSGPLPPAGVELRRYTASGALDTSFAQGGAAFLPAFPDESSYSTAVDIKALWQSSSGEWNVAVRSVRFVRVPFLGPPTQVEDATRLVRFLPDGSPDPSFAQYTKLDDAGAARITMLADGRIVHATSTASAPGCTIAVALGDAPAVGRMVEYYSAVLDHYFMTLEGGESVLLDGTPAGNGWQRTGQAFGAWTRSQLEGAVQLCRFYGDARAGPNSHFYTPQGGSECDALRALDAATPQGQPAWRFEGYAANVSLAKGGVCAANLSPVYRVYNKGFEKGGVPNHRYTTDPRTYADMQSKGWAGEGVAFCVPPIPNNATAVYVPGA